MVTYKLNPAILIVSMIMKKKMFHTKINTISLPRKLQFMKTRAIQAAMSSGFCSVCFYVFNSLFSLLL